MSDAIVFEKNLREEVNTDPFDSSRVGYITDSNGSSYSQQVTFDATTISTTESFLDWRSATIQVPVTLQVALNMPGATAALSAATKLACQTLVSMKSGHYHLFNSINVQYDGRSVTQQIENQNFVVNYNLLTQMSQDEEENLFDVLGMAKDSSESAGFSATLGAFNNSTVSVPGAVDIQNKGLVTRLQRVMKPSNTTRNPLNTEISSQNTHRPTWSVVTDINTMYAFKIDYVATVRLRDFHDIFDKLEMTKGSPVRITFNLNTVPSMGIPIVHANAGASTAWSQPVVTLMGQTNPIMVSDIGVGQNQLTFPAGVGADSAFLICKLGISNSYGATAHTMMPSCRLYYKSYTMNPTYEEMILNKGRFKDISYDDVYAYTMDASSTSFNQVIASSVSNLKKVIIIPYLKSGARGNVIAYPSFQSPFTPSPSTLDPLPVPLTNFQISIAGKNVFQNTLIYSWEMFQHVFAPSQGLNGDYITGLSSGLIGSKDWMSGNYGYYGCDVQHTPSDFTQPKSIQITGSNNSNKDINLYVFAIYQRSITIDLLTGKISDRS